MSKKLRIGSIGTGTWAQNFQIPAWRQLSDICEYIGMYNRTYSKAKVYADANGLKAYESLEELFDNCDAVDISVAHNSHLKYTKAALENKKHVMLQKPLVTTREALKELCDVQKKSGKVLMPYMMNRYREDFVKGKEIVASGVLGDILFVKSYNATTPPYGEFFISKKQAGGGVMITLGLHMLDILHWYFGKPGKIYHTQSNQLNNQYFIHNKNIVGDVEDNYTAMFDFNGVPAFLNTNWYLSENERKGQGFQETLEVIGTKGKLKIDAPSPEPVKLFLNDKGAVDVSVKESRSCYNLQKEFVMAIEENRTPMPSFEDAVTDLKTLFDMYEMSGDM